MQRQGRLKLVDARLWAFLAVVALGALAAAERAAAAYWIRAETTSVRAGTSLVLEGAAGGLPVYLVPTNWALVSTTSPCQGCAPLARKPPGPPAILLGRAPRTANPFAERRFRLRIPSTVPAGRFQVALFVSDRGRPGGSVIFGQGVVVVTRR